MATIRTIITEPHPTLRTPARPVAAADIHTPAFQTLCDDMIATMYAADGIGLAAPQINEPFRVIVIGKDAHEEKKDLVIINPEIDEYSWKTSADEEGCLSVPGVNGTVDRHISVRVRGLDRTGEPCVYTARGFFARVVQHEHDHINGILFIDRARAVHTVQRGRGL